MKTIIKFRRINIYDYALLGLPFLILSCQKNEILSFPNQIVNNQCIPTTPELIAENQVIRSAYDLFFDVPGANFEQALIELSIAIDNVLGGKAFI
jgi:hypothetical protein